MAAKNLSVVIPCFNEEANINRLVDSIEAVFNISGINGEIVLVDDGSLDSTAILIREVEKKRPNVIGVYHVENLGIVSGWRSGLEASSGEHVLTMDADMQYCPDDIAVLYNEIGKGEYDLVQGWRKFHESPVKDMLFRHILSISLSKFLNFVFSMSLRDIKSGFIVYKREVFKDVLGFSRSYRYFQHFITIAAHSLGYRIRQVPIKFYKRHAGKSFIKSPIIFSLKVCLEIPKAYINFRLRKH